MKGNNALKKQFEEKRKREDRWLKLFLISVAILGFFFLVSFLKDLREDPIVTLLIAILAGVVILTFREG